MPEYTGAYAFLSPFKNSLFNFHLPHNTPQTTMTKDEDGKIERKRLKRERQKANKRKGWAAQAQAQAQAKAQTKARVHVPARVRKVSFETATNVCNKEIEILEELLAKEMKKVRKIFKYLMNLFVNFSIFAKFPSTLLV
jgi:hypothetical protein